MIEETAEIETWLLATGVTPSRLGLLAAANPRAVPRIKDGSAQVATLMAVLKYIRDNPPAGSPHKQADKT
jgi:hypothetical protein